MDTVSLTKVALALLLVVALIGVLTLLARVFRLPEKWAGAGNKTRRMEIKEVLYVDAKNKVVLLRRDAVEHLLLISQNGVSVIETKIPQQGGEVNVQSS